MIEGILTEQSISLKNVLYFSGKLNSREDIKLQKKIEQILLKNNARKTGNTATFTRSFSESNGVRSFDIDLFVPTDRTLEFVDDLSFISEVRVDNALKVRIIGNPNQLNTALEQLIRYINENRLVPKTLPLLVTVKEATSPYETDEMITEIYMGIDK